MMRNPDVVGEVVEEPSPIAKKTQPDDMPMARQPSPPEKDESEAPPFTCKHSPPEGFAFGDTVRIRKMVTTGHLFEVGGIGFFPQTKAAKVSGTIAQVVCSRGTPATKGRVCLRKG
ncbi:unnamed protein product, partial [Symbiodinium pilosum]